MSKASYIFVPVQTDALYVPEEGLIVANQESDFSKIPFYDFISKSDKNTNLPHTSEAISSREFSNLNLKLGAGIHLHWTLPDSVTHGAQGQENLTFPAIPNRWMIKRTHAQEGEAATKSWVVESDFLFGEMVLEQGKAVSFPYPQDDAHPHPYRYIGRAYSLEDWIAKEKGELVLPKEPQYFKSTKVLREEKRHYETTQREKGLTVMGYGNYQFSGFYPDSFSMLGVYDDEIEVADLPFVKYQIVGWYADPEEDPVRVFLEEIQANSPEEAWFLYQLQSEFNDYFKWETAPWTTNAQEKRTPVLNTLCWSFVTFAEVPDVSLADTQNPARVTLAESGPEALAARMAEALLPDFLGHSPSQEEITAWEERLEALQLSPQLNERALDGRSRFYELRHEKSFYRNEGGTRWKISKVSGDEAVSEADQPGEKLLPPPLYAALGALNELQKQVDRDQYEIQQMRRQLFADWHKFIGSVYPAEEAATRIGDLEQMRYFLLEGVARPLEKRILAFEELKTALEVKGNEVLGLIDQYANTETGGTSRILTAYPAPSYWMPKEPVILIEGERPSSRHGKDGKLFCYLAEMESIVPIPPFEELFTLLETEIIGKEPYSQSGINQWEKQPWNPVFLEWEVSFLPVEEKSNLDRGKHDASFAPDYLTHNYLAPFNHLHRGGTVSPDLDLKDKDRYPINLFRSYSGRSILTDQANSTLRTQIAAFLHKNKLLEGCLPESEAFQTLSQFETHLWELEEAGDKAQIGALIGQIKTEYSQHYGSDDPVIFYLDIYAELLTHDFLSQAIGGFNKALLQRKPTLDLEIADPINFPLYRFFSFNRIAPLVGDELDEAPTPLQYFHPIRAGFLQIERLRLIDSFGRSRDLNISQFRIPSHLQTPENEKKLLKLLPRIVQPSRTHFEWKKQDQRTGPICGWIMANYLSNSIMFFDAEGLALGQLLNTQWIPAPLGVPSIAEIKDPEFRKFATHIQSISTNAAAMNTFINQMDAGLENIFPENASSTHAASMMAGQPLAIVRARIYMELQGKPELNQRYTAFEADLNDFLLTDPEDRRADPEKFYTERNSGGFIDVEIPLRLGETAKKNDGVVAYLIETPDLTSSEAYAGPIQFTHEELTSALTIPLNGKPIDLTLLVEVHGHIQVKTGILPRLEIVIPSYFYENSLSKMEFISLPTMVLTPVDQIQLPLVPGNGFHWSWLMPEPGNLYANQITTEGWIDQEKFVRLADEVVRKTIQAQPNSAIPAMDGTVLWNLLTDRKWLIERESAADGALHWVINEEMLGELESDEKEDPKDPFVTLKQALIRILEQSEYRIKPVEKGPLFSGTRNVIRDERFKLYSTEPKEPTITP